MTLYEILQDDVIPLYYARDEKLGYSPDWVRICKRSMASVLPHFNSQRVLHDYLREFYGPASRRGRVAAAENCAVARDLAAWRSKVRAAWPGVELHAVNAGAREVAFDEEVVLEVEAELNGLSPTDLRVECVLHRQLCSELTVPVKGYADSRRSPNGVAYIGEETVMLQAFEPQPAASGERCRYRLAFRPPWAGALSFEIRAVPQHPHLAHPYEVGLMRWL